MVTNILEAFISVVYLWLLGMCSHIIVEFVASAPLAPHKKLDNGVCPISFGIIWCRRVTKVVMKGVFGEMVWYLEFFQFFFGA